MIPRRAPVSNLARLQEQFQAYVLGRGDEFEAAIAARDAGDAHERLGIYRSAYQLRLLEALGVDYPGLKTLAGDRQFDALGRAYISAHPSHYPSIRWFGQDLAAFLRSNAPYADTPVLAEMASFETALSLSFDAADATPLGIEAIAAVPPEAWGQMRFTLHPSVQRVDLAWNVPTFWKAVREDQTPAPLEQGPYPLGWLTWRAGLVTQFRSLDVEEAWCIDAVGRGEDFGSICAGLCEWMDAQHTPGHAAVLLKRWVIDGLVTAVAYA